MSAVRAPATWRRAAGGAASLVQAVGGTAPPCNSSTRSVLAKLTRRAPEKTVRANAFHCDGIDVTAGGGGLSLSGTMDRLLVERAVTALNRQSGAEWAGASDVSAALQLTGADEKGEFAASLQLLKGGKDALKIVVAAMHPLVKAGWTLHWSGSNQALFYSNKRTRKQYFKNDKCPFGWAHSPSGFFPISDPGRLLKEPPSPKAAAAAISPRKSPSPRGEKRKREPGDEQQPSPQKQKHPARTSASEYKQYIEALDPTIRKKIECKREYFFRGMPPQLQQQIQMDEEASYSVTQMELAERTTVRILSALGWSDHAQIAITDATACVGGNTISFAKHFASVNAVEIDPVKAGMLAANCALLCEPGVVTVHCGDFTSAELQARLQQRVVFFDPPWGGEDYDKEQVELFLSGKSLASVCRGLVGKAEFVALKVPFNFMFEKFISEASAGGLLSLLMNEKIFENKGRAQPKFNLLVLRLAPG